MRKIPTLRQVKLGCARNDSYTNFMAQAPTQNTQEVGFVTDVRDFLVHLDGLPSVRINDLVESDDGALGFVGSLANNTTSVLMLTETAIKPGQLFRRSGKRLALPVGESLFGRVIDPLGRASDGKPNTGGSQELHELDMSARNIEARQFIDKQLLTGITLVDMLLPIAKGQRQLVLGDARSGKTSFLINSIINQKNTGVICIYAAIGKPITDVKVLLSLLSEHDSLKHTIIVAAPSAAPPPLIFLAPKAALTIAEYFQKKGKDVLVILDDMGNHAKIYREIALMEGKTPGREAYPGDIFYQQASVLERAGNFKKEEGGGSITALPCIELNLADFFTTFIPTNLMGMTDGHLLFSSTLHKQGQRPGIDISLSVTRVGLQTQDRLQNMLAGKIKSLLALGAQLTTLSKFSSELPPETQQVLHQKDLIEELIRQEPLTNIPKEEQIILLGLVFTSFLSAQDRNFVRQHKKAIIQGISQEKSFVELIKTIPALKTEEELMSKLESLSQTLEKICRI